MSRKFPGLQLGNSPSTLGSSLKRLRNSPAEDQRRLLTCYDTGAITEAIEHFIQLEQELPASYETLIDEGYLFFKPLITPDRWEIDGDTLKVTITFASMDTANPDDKQTDEVTHYRPGSVEYIDQKRRIAEMQWKNLQRVLNREDAYSAMKPLPPDNP